MKSYKKRLLFAGKESTYNDGSSVDGNNALEVFNLEVQPFTATTLERNLTSNILGNKKIAFSMQRVQVNFDLEVTTSGTQGTAPAYADLLKACAMKEVITENDKVTYTPKLDKTSDDSARIIYFVDGLKQDIQGCRGSFSLNFKAGEIPYFSFSFTGLYKEPEDTANGNNDAPTFPTVKGPLVFNQANSSAFQIGGTALNLDSLTVDLGNVMENNELIGTSQQVRYVDRAPTGTAVIELPTRGKKNLFDLLTKTKTFTPLTVTHGTANGKKLEVNVPEIDIRNVTYSEMDTIAMANLEFHAMPESNSGDDEIELIFK